MNGLVVLLYCIEILGALGNESTSSSTASVPGTVQDGSSSLKTNFISETTSITAPTTAISSLITESTAKVSNSHPASRSSVLEPTSTPNDMFYRKECLPVFMVSGGLIIACAILLVSTFLLAWKVCHLSRRIKALSSNADLISNTEFWMETAKKNKSMSDTEAKETSLLMADVSQTQEEMGNGTAKEEGGKVSKAEQMGDEDKKEVGDAGNGEAASPTPVTAAENPSSSTPQEEATDSQPPKDVAASSSEGTEELKDVV